MPLSAAAKKWARQKYGANWAFAKKSGVSPEEIRRRKIEAENAVAAPVRSLESEGESSDDEDIFAPYGGLAAYRDRTAAPLQSGIFDMPEVIVLNIVSNLDFLEILRLRGTSTKARAFIDDHLPQIYAEKRRKDPSLPEVEFLPRGAPDRDRRNLELFQDQLDRNRDVFKKTVSVHMFRKLGDYEEWGVEAEMDYDGMGYWYEPGNLVNAVTRKLREDHPAQFFVRDGIQYSPIVNLTVNTDLRSLEQANPVVFPKTIRNITFLVGEWENHFIDFDVTEEKQVDELKPLADKVEKAVRRLLRDQEREGRQIQIKVAVASYRQLLMMKGWDAIAESDMTVREYRAEMQRRIAATSGHQRRQWERLMPNFDRSFRSMVENHGPRLILNEYSTIYQLAYADRHDFEYEGGSPNWAGASIVRKIRL